jgi:hypothetical protein
MDCMGAVGGIFCSKSALIYSIQVPAYVDVKVEASRCHILAAQVAANRRPQLFATLGPGTGSIPAANKGERGR